LQLPRECYQAVFSASAIHWADPDLSWRKIADVLAPDGTLALIQYFGLQQQRSADDQEQLLSATRIACIRRKLQITETDASSLLARRSAAFARSANKVREQRRPMARQLR
jgi:hypothetical protein